MKIIQRFLGGFGYVKKAAQRAYFKGAQASRLLMDWITSPLSADVEIRSDLLKLRARARDLARNNPFIRHYLSLLAANVIGPHGIKLQAQVRNNNGDLNKRINDAIESGWSDWSRSVSTDGRLSLTQFCNLAIKSLATDGEAFIRIVNADLNKSNFALQLIDPDLVDHDYNQSRGHSANGVISNEIRLGVEVDEWMRPVAYHLWDRHASDVNGSARKRLRIPASDIIHIYDPERIDQTRGVTWFNSIIVPLKMFDGYTEAELVAARTSAAKMGFLRYTDQAAAALDSEIPNQPLQFEASPGTIEMLPPGLEFQEWNPQHPSTAFETFGKQILRQIASGLRVSYNALTNDLENVNYSSIRSGMLIERDMWRTFQQLWIERFMQPVFERWLKTAMISGAIVLDSRDPAKFTNARWLPRGWAWVDPLKDINASILAINNGLASRTDILAETGGDYEETLANLSDEKRMADEAGVVLGVTNVQAVAEPTNATSSQSTQKN